MREKIYIIDGTAIVYRSFYAFQNRPLINSKGENTSAIFGFLRTLVSIIEKFKPNYLVLTFDEREPTFRHKKYKDYKATREKIPEDLADQLEPIQKLVEAAKIPKLSLPGYEADDIIGTLVKKLAEKYDIVIVSGDKDMYQLVSNHVCLFDPLKDRFIRGEEVKKRFGLSPEKVVDALALIGDSADNVPGIPSIGEKTAEKLIKDFGSVENLIKSKDKIMSPRIRENVEKYAEQGLLSKELVTINQDVPIDISPEELRIHNIFGEELKEFCKRYELNSFLKYFSPEEESPSSKKDSPIDYILLTEKKDFEKFIKGLKEHKNIALDVETDSLCAIDGKIVGISFCFEPQRAYYIPLRHHYGHQLDAKYALDALKPYLEDSAKCYIGHNIKFDYMIFQNEGIEIANIYFDTMIAAYLLAPDEHRHNLDAVSMQYLQRKMIPIENMIGKKGKNQINFSETSPEEAAIYSGEDANVSFQLWSILEEKLKELDLSELFFKIEMPLVKTLAAMERNGISIDIEWFAELSKDLGAKLEILKKEIYELAGEEFNIDSPQQLAYILFEKLGLPPVKRTKSGFSTDIEVLTKLSRDYEIAEKLIDYRQLKKLKSTYIDTFPKLVHPKTGRIHSSFNQTVTATGRLSSSEPNLQNIPIRSEIGKEMRKGIIPQSKEFSILSADYSQIELRIMAIISQDKNLIENFQKGGDIHAQTASLVFGIPRQEVTPDQRRRAKVINFGIMYGMGPHALSQELGISHSEAQEFIDNYFDHYPGVKKYIDQTIEFAHKNGYVKTLFNRRRYLDTINSRNKQVRAFAERMAINMPIQGTAADIIKIAMNNIQEKIKKSPREVKLIIQVHDELVFEVKTDKIDQYKKLVKEEMESVLPDQYSSIIPLEVDIGYGKNWLEAH
jgi:DNA polymerase-1